MEFLMVEVWKETHDNLKLNEGRIRWLTLVGIQVLKLSCWIGWSWITVQSRSCVEVLNSVVFWGGRDVLGIVLLRLRRLSRLLSWRALFRTLFRKLLLLLDYIVQLYYFVLRFFIWGFWSEVRQHKLAPSHSVDAQKCIQKPLQLSFSLL